MCPDRELLSAYLDGEVPSPWKERIADELQNDAECAAVYAQLCESRRVLQSDPEPDFAASKQAVWQRIADMPLVRKPIPLWRRRVALPIPVAAAAASLLMLLAGGLLWHTARATVRPNEIAASSVGNELVVRIGEISIEELLRIMNASETVGELTVTLPDSATFGIFGEPQLVRAADFRREEPLLVPLEYRGAAGDAAGDQATDPGASAGRE